MSDTADFFRGRIEQMIDLRHPLVVLGTRMPWQEVEAALAGQFARRVREGQRLEGTDLFGPSTQLVGAGVSKAGRPRLPMRLMISLLYLKHAFNESDEALVERWGETPIWQFFSGMDYYEHRRACDPTVLVKFRRLLGEAGVEELLAQTINVAANLKLIERSELSDVIVDSTVAPKAVAYPTDSRLLETARAKLVEAAKAQGIALKQTYAKEGAYLRLKAGRYAHAKQFKRMRSVIRRQRTIVGRLQRSIQTRVTTLTQAIRETLAKASRVFEQTATRKTAARKTKPKTATPKLYSWHAPEVVCMSKGKARTPYEFGSKVGIATTLRGNLIVGARAFEGNPYDGHTLAEQVEQATILMQDTGVKPNTAWVDLGYRGVDAENPAIQIKHRGKKTRLTALEIKTLKRRQAIEPVIGHLKADHRLGRCHLKGTLGDKLHAVLCAAGYNIRWLLRMIRAKGLRAFLRLLRAMAPTTVWSEQRLGFGWHRALLRLSHRHQRTSYALAAG
jgi:IS5 family transposase